MATSEQMKATFKKYLYKNEAIQMFIMWEVIMNNWKYSVFYDLPSAFIFQQNTNNYTLRVIITSVLFFFWR